MEKNNKKFGNILFPPILIVAGVIFLLQNLGLLTGSAWDMLFSLWPLLIILLGINDLIRNRGIVGPTLSIGFGLIFLLSNLDILNWGAWMTILRLWPILVIALGLEIFIGRKNIWLSIVGVGFTLILLVGGLWYSGGILSVGESDLDLSNLQISEFSLDMGVGQTTLILPNGQYQAQIDGGVGQTIVHLPDEGEIELNVDGGVGEIRIYIPEDMPAKIYVDRGIAGLSIPSSYDKDEDVYTSPRFSERDDHVIIYISQGIGSIVVREE